ncbi:MAG: class I SAM-dependent methyltransferase [Nisaea sp.]|jgi:2-polyprenyl-3-methyl-5-hydroxy-6-metoxy-1,4-benzoquinol methylase|uniref:class I SAM-dependent methyltransferase n=1 Tax=Nisaea sp. TaxID=2024842 RepID=UPI001B0370FA|nr:class I SAM-dependent methyltransferase [Nisaea sp.]MBO6560159.1 class I SAM-dependent methyltransferase [Nisaea sp.]
MKLTFDQIHSATKQHRLREMMLRTVQDVAQLPNSNAKRTRCPICDAPDIAHFVQAFGFDMDRCGDCGLIFCNPYPTATQLDLYYNSEMKDFENEFFRETFEARAMLFSKRVELIRALKPSGRLLDIGSAIGIFVESLRRAQAPYEITACDLNAAACEQLAQTYGDIEILNCDAKDLDQHNAYDVVTMWDTLEHIVDLDELLATVRRLLRPDGIFAFSTPNTDSFEWLVAGNRHVQILPPGHVNLLNTKNIVRLLEKNGFGVRDQMTLNPSLDISYVLKLLDSDPVVAGRTDAFLQNAIKDPEFQDMLSDYLVQKRMAGNVVTCAFPFPET